MSDQIAKGEEFEKQAEKKLNGWKIFGSKHEDAADLYEKAANFYKIGKSWDQAGAVYMKLADCYLKLDSKHEAANAFADAGHCYKKTNTTECISCLEQALNLFMEIGRLGMSAKYCKEIAELYEQEQNLEQAMVYYDKASDLFQGEEVSSSANQCRLKIAQFAAELQQHSINNNLLKYGVKGHLLNAGICQLCKGDVVAITNALDKYQDLDPTFAGSREYRLLADLAASIDEEDVEKFTDAIKEFDSITKLDAWKTTLLLRVKDMLKAKEMEEDDLT
ncbi:NSF attachment protein [Cynara cardunculus var. scolymus]|uniref:NSF attachment protein n=1 Tax=Cynara cardunculus var. scolymus TaxID=59895 RepID=A0A124SGP5_CYNCS|nr:NSF attachment protein [Cynara cardunculus var. scolymus]